MHLVDYKQMPAQGRVVMLVHPYPDGEQLLACQFSKGLSNDELAAALREDVGRLGVTVSELHRQERWSYFPHLDEAALASGFHRRIEALQGQRNTYLAGSALSFESVAQVTAYAQAMAERFFAPAGR